MEIEANSGWEYYSGWEYLLSKIALKKLAGSAAVQENEERISAVLERVNAILELIESIGTAQHKRAELQRAVDTLSCALECDVYTPEQTRRICKAIVSEVQRAKRAVNNESTGNNEQAG